MTLKLRFYPDPVLKTVSASVPDNALTPGFLREMFQLMKAKGGIGLSAIQVGVAQRIIVLDVGQGPEFYINPEVQVPADKKRAEVFGELQKVREGCLSVPGVFEEILRYPNWNIKYRDEKYENRVREAVGIRAHVLQHEMEHLDGKLFVDKLPAGRRGTIMAIMMKMRRQGTLR